MGAVATTLTVAVYEGVGARIGEGRGVLKGGITITLVDLGQSLIAVCV